MKKLAVLICSILAVQSLTCNSIAFAVNIAPSETVTKDGSLSGRATLKNIGPLHLSEGIVIMRDNEIIVLSDAADPIKEAELSGLLLHAHAQNGASSSGIANNTIAGIALFTKGYSISALDTSPANESIQCIDGAIYVGHITEVNFDSVRMSTNNGIKDIGTKNITKIKSPRAFDFEIAENSAAAKVADASVATARNQISFNSTYTVPTSATQTGNTAIALHASTVHRQLAERSRKRSLSTTALVVAGFAACLAIPAGVALTCPPAPKNGN
jgi:hypothetical protein